MVVSYPVGAGNQTHVLWRGSRYSQPLSHLSITSLPSFAFGWRISPILRGLPDAGISVSGSGTIPLQLVPD